MSKDRNNKRETRKPKRAIPKLDEDIYFPKSPKIRRPKASNKAAIKRIAHGDYFWDKKAIEASLKKGNKSLVWDPHVMNPQARHLGNSLKLNQILEAAPNWLWSSERGAFYHLAEPQAAVRKPIAVPHTAFEELKQTLITHQPLNVHFKIQGLTKRQSNEISRALDKSIKITFV